MTHDEFQTIAAAGGPATPEEEAVVREHVESCPECLSAAVQPAAADGRGFGWWFGILAILFLALWIWREAGMRVAREQTRSERAEIKELTNANSVLKEQKEKLADELSVISAPDVQTIALVAPAAGAARGRLFVDPSVEHAVLVTTGLPTTGKEADYELWLYGPDGSPSSGGLFGVTNGHATVNVPTMPKAITNVVVTLEKNGGSPQPGPNVVLSGRP